MKHYTGCLYPFSLIDTELKMVLFVKVSQKNIFNLKKSSSRLSSSKTPQRSAVKLTSDAAFWPSVSWQPVSSQLVWTCSLIGLDDWQLPASQPPYCRWRRHRGRSVWERCGNAVGMAAPISAFTRAPVTFFSRHRGASRCETGPLTRVGGSTNSVRRTGW